MSWWLLTSTTVRVAHGHDRTTGRDRRRSVIAVVWATLAAVVGVAWAAGPAGAVAQDAAPAPTSPPASTPSGSALGGTPAATDSTQEPDLRNVSLARLRVTGVDTPSSGHVGVDVFLGADEYAPCFNPGESKAQACAQAPPSYYEVRHWTPTGSDFSGGIDIPNSEPARDNPSQTVVHGFANKMSKARVEFYPYGPNGQWDPSTQDYGGVAFYISPWSTYAYGAVFSPDIGVVRLPRRGQPGVGRIDGAIRSNPANPIADQRFDWQVFQTDGFTTTTAGYPQGGFAVAKNKGAAWSTGPIFNGKYLINVQDTLLHNSISAEIVVNGDMTLDLDADAPCFGFDVCQYTAGAPVQPTGGFHPVAPARVLDTRSGLGHTASPVRPGEGASADIDYNVRAAEAANHEVKVTGVGGVPASGVAAVLVNVTAVNASAPASYLTVFPKPPRRTLFEDQSAFGNVPFASNLNFGAGKVVPNLVVAKVGAGGKARLYNNTGTTDVLFDVVGWFDSNGAAGADGFTGVTPTRLLDTRGTGGGADAPLGAGEVRTLAVAGAAGSPVPADASAVVMNVTAVFPTAISHLSVFPGGQPVPNASNLNMAPGQVVPNLVVVPVGSGGTVSLRNNSGEVHVLADVVGYFRAGSGGKLAPRSPVRILDTRSGTGGPASSFGPGEQRDLQVAGVNGVPGNATAVVMNVTVTGPTQGSHVTVWPAGVGMPTASNLNVSPGLTVANLVMVKVGAGGKVSLYNNSGTAHLIADVVGWYA